MGHPLQSLNTVACALSAICFAGAAMPATAADWKPERAVEFVVPAPAGGALDGPARVVQKIWQELKLVDVPVNIINRSGGGQTVGATYVQQAANDAHRLLLISGPLLSNHITGRSKLHYTDFTILGQLFTEYNALSVNADGAIRTVNDLIARLKPAAQIAYWDGVLRKTVASPEWKKILVQAQWVDAYVGSADMRKHLDNEYAERRKILTDLGLAK